MSLTHSSTSLTLVVRTSSLDCISFSWFLISAWWDLNSAVMKSLESFMLFSRATSSCIIVLLNWLSDVEFNPNFVTWRGLFLILSLRWVFPSSHCAQCRVAKNKLYWEKEKKREEKEEKEKRKKKKKEEKNKKQKKRGESKQKSTSKKQGGVSSDSVYCKSLNFPWNFSSAAWLIICFSPVGLAGPLGEGPAVLIFRC